MRASARLIVGRLALLVFIASVVLPNFANRHLLTAFDPDCGVFPTADHARPAFEAVKASSASHCAICHWLRSLRDTAPATTAQAVAAFIVTERVPTGAIDPAGHSPRFDPPSRAPPADASFS